MKFLVCVGKSVLLVKGKLRSTLKIEQHIHDAYHILNALHVLAYTIFKIIIRNRYNCYSHFTDEETETQGGSETCP
jgi:hypothetical protein